MEGAEGKSEKMKPSLQSLEHAVEFLVRDIGRTQDLISELRKAFSVDDEVVDESKPICERNKNLNRFEKMVQSISDSRSTLGLIRTHINEIKDMVGQIQTTK